MDKIIDLLTKSNVTAKENFKLFNKGTRDRKDVNVLKCEHSDILILDKVVTDKKYYENNINYTQNGVTNINNKNIKTFELDDELRRFDFYKKKIKNKKILDFGCGKGHFLTLCNKINTNSYGVELNIENRNLLLEKKIIVKENVDDFEIKFDLIFLNHVLEHLSDPVKILNSLKDKLNPNGEIIIEVPHAKDLLIHKLNLKEFKDFTFWSEHIILHTKDSLSKTMQFLGFKKEKIFGIQRYPLSNHIHWLHKGKAGGHKILEFINTKNLIDSYEQMLVDQDFTDTIIGVFKK